MSDLSNTRNGTSGIIFNIMRFAVHDGPGIRTTVFLKGCPLQCAWCHNPESLTAGVQAVLRHERCLRCGECAEACPSQAVVPGEDGYVLLQERCVQCGTCVDVCVADARELIGREVTAGVLLTELEKDIPFYEQSGGGVTFSGGEPLLQHAFLVETLQLCKARGLHTAVDTTGFTTPEILRRVSAWTDLFLFDIKSLNDDVHRRFTGVSNRRILENLRLLDQWQKPVSLRVPVIPGVNDRLEDLEPVARLAASLPAVRDLHLLPFHTSGVNKYRRVGRDYTFPSVTPPSPETLQALAETLRSIHPRIRLGG